MLRRPFPVLVALLVIFCVNAFGGNPFVQTHTLTGTVIGGSQQYGSGNVVENLNGYSGSTIIVFTGTGFSIQCQYGNGGQSNTCLVPAGINATTYQLYGNYVSTDTAFTVTASVYGTNDPGIAVSGVNKAPHSSISFASSVVGGSTDHPTATVTVDAPVYAARSVTLSSSSSLFNFGPGAKTIPAGGTSVAFPLISSTVVVQPLVSTLSCDYGVGCSATATDQVNPVTVIASSPITGNSKAQGYGTVTLGSSIQNAGSITFANSPSDLTLPGSVTIPAGGNSVGFNFTAFAVSNPLNVTLTASYATSASTNVIVDPTGKDADTVCPDCAQGGRPINLTNGNVWISQQDFSLPSIGGGLQLTRTWNSLWQNNTSIGTAGVFGDSWRSNLEERLEFVASNGKKYWRADGGSWLFNYDTNSQGYILVSPANEHATLTYSSSTTLYTLTFRDGTQRTFNTNGYLVTWADRNGVKANITLNTASRPTQITLTAQGVTYRTVTLSYNTPGNAGLVSSVQDTADGIGTIATYVYDSTSHLTQVVYYGDATSALNYAYTNGLITSVTDADGKTLETHTYAADNSRRGTSSSGANGVDAITVSYTSATSTRITDSLGNFTDYTYTPVQSSSTVHVRNYVTAVSGPGCASCGLRNNTTFGYDAGFNKNHVVDANGHASDFTFDQLTGDMLTKTQHLDDGTPVTWTYTYNSFGEVLTAQDPLGVVTKNEYDVQGNLTCTSPDSAATTCSNAAIKTKFAYNTAGQLTQITDPRDTTQVPIKTNITYVASGNGAGMIQTITDAQSNVTTYAYDARGNRTSVKDPVNGSGNPTTFTYDAQNRLTRVTYPAISPNPATHTDFTYDKRGRRTTVTDANGKVTSYAYDDADRLTKVTDAQQPNPGITQYFYDSENNLTGIRDAANHPDTTFQYDALGHVKQTNFPVGSEVYTYDQMGNLKTKLDRNAKLTTYNYDPLNRLTSKIYDDSSEVDYAYDLAGRLTQASGSAANGTYALAYDNLGRLMQADSTYGFLASKTWTLKYTYDAASNRATMVNPQNASTTYVYDTLNRLSSLQSPQGTFGFSYDGLGRRTQLTRPNGVNSNYSYDSLSRLLSVLHQVATSTPLDGATYTYDNAGNRVSKTDNRTSTTSNYGYDNIYQLTSTTGGSAETYTYDLVGNRLTSAGVSSYVYNNSNELTSTSNATYTYDANGNTKTKIDSTGTTTYNWDFENSLTSVVLPGSGGTVSFAYDPFGRRIKKSSSSNTSIYVYDGADQLQEVDSTGNTVVASYVMGPGIDQPLSETRGATTSFYQADGLGSATSLTDSTATIANSYSYDSFGNQTATTGTVSNPFRFTARELDSETGLMFYRARYYDQVVGRFLSEDSARFGVGVDFYAYVLNSPPNLKDPSGEDPFLDGMIQTLINIFPGSELKSYPGGIYLLIHQPCPDVMRKLVAQGYETGNFPPFNNPRDHIGGFEFRTRGPGPGFHFRMPYPPDPTEPSGMNGPLTPCPGTNCALDQFHIDLNNPLGSSWHSKWEHFKDFLFGR